MPESFMKSNYLNYFNIMTFKGGTYLFKQGDIKTSLFFMTDGDINLYSETTIHNIINIIEYLRKDVFFGIKTDIATIKQELEQELDIIKEYHIQNKEKSLFNKFCTIKRTFKIYYINKKETLGFDDLLFKDDKFFANAKIMSNSCHIYLLKTSFLNSILRENIILRNYNRINFEKKMLMIKRLTAIVRMLINQFLNKYKISISIPYYLNTKKNTETKILKTENISVDFFKNKNEKKYLLGNNKKLNSLPDNLNIEKTHIKTYYLSKPKKKWNFDNIDNYLKKNKKENEKNNLIISSNNMITFKNKLLNIHINYSNDNLLKKNKLKLAILEKYKIFERFKRKRNKTKKEKLKTKTFKFNSEDDINKIIPKMEKLGNKLMIDKYDYNKNLIKNMSQYDFIFYEYFFINQGNKHYCKQPLLFDT